MKYQVLLSDADGTLFDFLAGEEAALQMVLAAFGLPTDEATVTLYSRINESHWKRFERGETTQARLRVERFQEFLDAIQVSKDASAMSECYVEALSQQRILLPGALALCQAVSRHLPIFLVTNGLSRVQRSRFDGCAIAPYIAGFLISEEVGHPKPEPHMLQEAMRQAGIADPCQAVLLGDSLTADIGAAQAAGVDSILFLDGKAAPSEHGATYVAQTLEEATKLILQ